MKRDRALKRHLDRTKNRNRLKRIKEVYGPNGLDHVGFRNLAKWIKTGSICSCSGCNKNNPFYKRSIRKERQNAKQNIKEESESDSSFLFI